MSSAIQLAKLQRDLQVHLLEGDDAIETAIDSTENVSAATRLQIYFDAYRLRLIEALQANYPVLAKLLVEDEFSNVSQRYLLTNPSHHYSIRWFGHNLAQFLSEESDFSDQPWLAELAEWEWKIAAAFDASDANILSVDELATVAPERWPTLGFAFHPSLRRIGLTTNVVSIVKAESKGEPLPSPARIDVRSEWLIWRNSLDVQYRPLDSAESAALDAALRGAAFGEICEIVSEHCDADAAPLRAASLLKQWLVDGCVIGLSPA
jgi:hypothetical protein